MKKKLITIISVMTIAVVIGLTSSKLGVVSADPYYSIDDIRNQVTELYPGEITELELEREGNKPVYEVEIKVDGYEYELKIDGNTGEILKLEEKQITSDRTVADSDAKKKDSSSNQRKEKVSEPNRDNQVVEDNKVSETKDENNLSDEENKTETRTNVEEKEKSMKKDGDDKLKKIEVSPSPPPEKKDHKSNEDDPSTKKNGTKKTVISIEEVKKIALSQFSGTITEIELDDDDDRLIYEVEIKDGNREAEIEIDAYTGDVLVLEIELDD